MSYRRQGAIDEMCINAYGLPTASTQTKPYAVGFFAFENTEASHLAMDKSALIALVITTLLLRC